MSMVWLLSIAMAASSSSSTRMCSPLPTSYPLTWSSGSTTAPVSASTNWRLTRLPVEDVERDALGGRRARCRIERDRARDQRELQVAFPIGAGGHGGADLSGVAHASCQTMWSCAASNATRNSDELVTAAASCQAVGALTCIALTGRSRAGQREAAASSSHPVTLARTDYRSSPTAGGTDDARVVRIAR
jgi:hypothetical protein